MIYECRLPALFYNVPNNGVFDWCKNSFETGTWTCHIYRMTEDGHWIFTFNKESDAMLFTLKHFGCELTYE